MDKGYYVNYDEHSFNRTLEELKCTMNFYNNLDLVKTFNRTLEELK